MLVNDQVTGAPPGNTGFGSATRTTWNFPSYRFDEDRFGRIWYQPPAGHELNNPGDIAEGPAVMDGDSCNPLAIRRWKFL